MLDVLLNIIHRFINECLGEDYELLLEADVCGCLFHLLWTQPEINSQHIHLDTRVCCVDRRRFDIAIGPIVDIQNVRPCIKPQVVVEVKLFPRIGFTNQQNRVHYIHIINKDLPILGELDSSIFCAELIIDNSGYLCGNYRGQNRLDYLINKRNQIAPGVHIFIIQFIDNNWQINHI